MNTPLKQEREAMRAGWEDWIIAHVGRIAWCVEALVFTATLAVFFTIVVPILPAGLALLFG